MTQDVLIRGARIVDGTGAPWFMGDVRLSGGRIAAVAPSLAEAGQGAVIDAAGRYLAPGFIDAHAHDDLIFLRERERVEKALQGVTTIVVGNCSFSLYPKVPASAEALRRHFGAMLGDIAEDEVFDGFAAHRERLEGQGVAINVVSLVGHAALRLAVIGDGAREATAAERAAMQSLLAVQLAAGAAGLSLGLVYPPSAYADMAELVALGRTVAAHGAVLAAHIRSYEAGLGAAVDEFVGILKATGARGLLSHLQAAGRPNWGGVAAALARLDAARVDGVDVSFDMYPYLAGSSYLLQLLPPSALDGGLPALLARLDDNSYRERLRRAVEEGSGGDAGWQSKVWLIGWGNVRISAVGNAALKRLEGKSLADAARDEGIAPFELMVRLVVEDGGQTGIVMFQLSEDDLRTAFTHPLHMVGSDSLPRPGTKPHPRAYGSFPRVAGHLARDLGWFPLEDAVRRMTSAPAQHFGLDDRGLIRPGMGADLVLFDASIADRATFDRPTELAAGIVDVFVGGARIVAAGRPTGALPGRVLIRPRRRAEPHRGGRR